MVLSEREKYVAMALGAVLVLVVLDRLIYSPLSEWSDQISKDQASALDKADSDRRLSQKLKRLNVVWEDMKKNGLKSDVSDAQSQLSNAVRDWAEQSGVKIVDTRSENASIVDPKTGFISIAYTVTCTGTTSSIAKLLFQIESAKIPIRINNLRVNSTKDGVDDLNVQLNLSTLCVPSVPNRPAPNTPPVVSSTPPGL